MRCAPEEKLLDEEARRLLWRCRRGMKELDVLLERYVRSRLSGASSEERQVLARLLELPDPVLSDYLLGHAAGELHPTVLEPLGHLVDRLIQLQRDVQFLSCEVPRVHARPQGQVEVVAGDRSELEVVHSISHFPVLKAPALTGRTVVGFVGASMGFRVSVRITVVPTSSRSPAMPKAVVKLPVAETA